MEVEGFISTSSTFRTDRSSSLLPSRRPASFSRLSGSTFLELSIPFSIWASRSSSKILIPRSQPPSLVLHSSLLPSHLASLSNMDVASKLEEMTPLFLLPLEHHLEDAETLSKVSNVSLLCYTSSKKTADRDHPLFPSPSSSLSLTASCPPNISPR